MDGQRLIILKMLLESDDYISYDAIAGKLSISSRTVVRFLKDIEAYTMRYQVKIQFKKRFGLKLEGTNEQLEQLMKSIEQQKIFSYTSNERMIIIMLELLSNEESVKLYYLSYLLNVSIGTINRDLETIQDYLLMNHINLQSQRGVGVSLQANRKDLLWICANFILPYVEFRKTNDGKNVISYNHLLCLDVQKRLNEFLDLNEIRTMHELIDAFDFTMASDFIQEDYHHYIILSSLLVFHEALWSQRTVYTFQDMILLHPMQYRIREFSKKLRKELGINMLDDACTMLCSAYLAMRKADSKLDGYRYDEDIYRTTIELLDVIESDLRKPLNRDMNLIERLTMHMKLMLTRVQMGVIISNSYLDSVREEYRTVFDSVKKHISIFQNRYKCVINDNEIGYITIHILATLMEQENDKQRMKVAILCMSGMGTSKMLKERLKSKYPLMDVEFACSIHNFNEAVLIKKGFDLIVSTILIETVSLPCVIVHPVMSDYDFDTLNQLYFKTIETKGVDKNTRFVKMEQTTEQQSFNSKQDILKRLSYCGQIIQNFAIERCTANSYKELLQIVAEREIQKVNQEDFLDWVLRRETYGSTIIEESGIILIHGRIKDEHCLKIYSCTTPFSYLVDGKDYRIRKALVMIAPQECEDEYLELMSSVSTAFVQNQMLLQAIQDDDQASLLRQISKALLMEVV